MAHKKCYLRAPLGIGHLKQGDVAEATDVTECDAGHIQCTHQMDPSEENDIRKPVSDARPREPIKLQQF